MDFGIRSMSYNGVPQFQKRLRPGDEPTFGKRLSGKAEEEEEEAKLKKGEFKPHKLPVPGFHIIA